MEEAESKGDPVAAVEELPWCRGSTDAQPFVLSKLLSQSSDLDAPPFHCTSVFPWTISSMDTLWDGLITDETVLNEHKTMVSDYAGSVAIGGTGALYVFPRLATAKPFCVRLPDPTWEVHCIAWLLSSQHPTDPLIVFTPFSLIYVLHVKARRVVSRLRGHGGPVTSIAVHPTHPYIFCTTSRDFTTRIYDLTLEPTQLPNNPHWPPSKQPSRAGPAHGLQSTEPEGEGMGSCVAVLVGGRSGGHRGAVFCAAFHRTLPLIATCGMDRAVKIWCIPPLVNGRLAREDKPLFSTDYIHKARVLSIAWLSHDILISHSAPALMRRSDRMDDLYDENGTVQIWQWLGFNRFFPPDRAGKPIPKVMRGCASDYRNSESFKVLSAYHLPLTALSATVYTSPTSNHDPLFLIPIGKCIRVFNITHFKARPPPPFPHTDESIVDLTKRMRLDEDSIDQGAGEWARSAQDDQEGDEEREEERAEGEEANDREDSGEDGEQAEDGEEDGEEQAKENEQYMFNLRRQGYMPPGPSRLLELFTAVEGWDVDLSAVPEAKRAALSDITACEVTSGGRVIVGVGAKGTLYIWRLREQSSSA